METYRLYHLNEPMALRRNHIEITKYFEVTNIENLGELCLLKLLGISPLVVAALPREESPASLGKDKTPAICTPDWGE